LKANQSLKDRLKNVRKTLKKNPADVPAQEMLKEIESNLRKARDADEAAIRTAGSGIAGTVTPNALTGPELSFATELAKKTNKHFIGPPRANFPGIDGWLGDVPVQLKETGGSLQGVLTVVSQAETKAINADRRGIDVYVKAKSVSTMDMLNFAFKGPMDKIRNNKILSNIWIETADGSMRL